MKGFITIKAEEQGEGTLTSAQVELQEVGKADKAVLLSAFLNALEISQTDALVLLLMIQSGAVSSVEVGAEDDGQ